MIFTKDFFVIRDMYVCKPVCYLIKNSKISKELIDEVRTYPNNTISLHLLLLFRYT